MSIDFSSAPSSQAQVPVLFQGHFRGQSKGFDCHEKAAFTGADRGLAVRSCRRLFGIGQEGSPIARVFERMAGA
jgi:hypothetical protein